jgi:hypothetical protein
LSKTARPRANILLIFPNSRLICRYQDKVSTLRYFTWLRLRPIVNHDQSGSTEGDFMIGRKGLIILTAIVLSIVVSGCSGGSLSTREKGAGIGALGGATAGGLIGAATGHPAAGAGIGAALGLGAGALVGDQLQGQERVQSQQQQQIDQNQTEIQRQRQQIEQLKRRQEY